MKFTTLAFLLFLAGSVTAQPANGEPEVIDTTGDLSTVSGNESLHQETEQMPRPRRYAKDIEFENCPDPLVEIRAQHTPSGESMDEVVAVFAKVDLNNDNRICRAEVEAVSPDNIMFWARMDKNNDACITLTEARQYLEQQVMSAWVLDFSVIDGNKDGVLSMVELNNRFGEGSEGTLTPKQIMDEYDLDYDGSITKHEYITRNIEIYRTLRVDNPQFTGITPAPIKSPTTPRSVRDINKAL